MLITRSVHERNEVEVQLTPLKFSVSQLVGVGLLVDQIGTTELGGKYVRVKLGGKHVM